MTLIRRIWQRWCPPVTHRGRFASFAEAGAPARSPYDSEAYAEWAKTKSLAWMSNRVTPTPLPSWTHHTLAALLSSLPPVQGTIGDVGGGVGWHYQQLCPFQPPHYLLDYYILEVPAVRAMGERYHMGCRTPRYVDHLEPCHVLLLSNVLQYIDNWVAFIHQLRPAGIKAVVVSKNYAYAGESFVTRNEVLPGHWQPMHVFNTLALVQAFTSAGYTVQRTWPEDRPFRLGRLHIPQSNGYLFTQCP